MRVRVRVRMRACVRMHVRTYVRANVLPKPVHMPDPDPLGPRPICFGNAIAYVRIYVDATCICGFVQRRTCTKVNQPIDPAHVADSGGDHERGLALAVPLLGVLVRANAAHLYPVLKDGEDLPREFLSG